ncbi:MAG: hypothetical protein EOP06_04450 [Proteobacteria bacterium]|nr:MAG: hypothetical protein EOP06_04450 [Pseudomonadota bacterium]
MKLALTAFIFLASSLAAPFASARTMKCAIYDETVPGGKPSIEEAKEIATDTTTLISGSTLKTALFSCDGVYHPTISSRSSVLIAEIYIEQDGYPQRIAQSETVLTRGHAKTSTLVTYIYDRGTKEASCKCMIED